MNDIYKNWDYEQFITFIMYYAAQADFQLAPEEKQLILQRISQDEFMELRNFFHKNSDYDNIQVIMFFKDKYRDERPVMEDVNNAISKVFDSDGELHYYEKNMKNALQLLLT